MPQGIGVVDLMIGFPHRDRRAVYDYLVATAPVSADVTLLSVADRLAARGEGPLASRDMVEASRVVRRHLEVCIVGREDFPAHGPTPIIICLRSRRSQHSANPRPAHRILIRLRLLPVISPSPP